MKAVKGMSGLMRQVEASNAPPPAPEPLPEPKRAKTGKRENTRMIAGHFSPDLARVMGQIALDNDTSIQALLGEALDLLLPVYGREPFGER